MVMRHTPMSRQAPIGGDDLRLVPHTFNSHVAWCERRKGNFHPASP